MAEIGRISLVVAFVVTAYLTVGSALGIVWRQPEVLASTRRAVYAATSLITLAWVVLLYAFATHDFSLQAVAHYNSRATDVVFSLSGVYAGQEGSLLMWAWGVMLMLLLVTIQFRGRYKSLMPWVTAVMGFVATFFLSILTFISDPFVKSVPIPADGQGLNPLLQNVGMLFHPPTLYLGYVAFTVPFAFAIAALITGQLGDEWIRITRGWTLAAWVFLGVGNLLGAQWAYTELGWGGYWGWDPVENSSFMPWLTGTAFLHSVMMQKRKGMLKIWNLSLIIATFLLTIFGTFLTRSDILSSVHTFGETGLGPLFIAMMALTIAVSIALIWDRAPLLESDADLDSLVSRESAFLLNNLLLVLAAFAIFVLTMLPVVGDAFGGRKLTIGPDYFNRVVGPILLVIVFLMGICPLVGWRANPIGQVLRGLRVSAATAVVVAVVSFFLGANQIHAVLGMAACGFVAGTVGVEYFRGARAKGRMLTRNPVLSLPRMIWDNRPKYGGYVVHLGIVVMAIGVIGSQGFKIEKDVSLTPGQEATIGSYRIVYNGLSSLKKGDTDVVQASLTAYSGSQLIGTMSPSKEFHPGYDNPNTEVAIHSIPTEDLYLILNSWDNQQKAGLKLVINPLVSWLWAGGYLLLLGSIVAFWPGAGEKRAAPRSSAKMPVSEAVRTAGA
ncbi:MAG TPA: heme lyase CcmF/NrfE family subunit [Chloroflexota bacterium]